MEWLVIAGLAVILYSLHRVFLWMEQKGWIYYVKKRPPGSYARTTFLEFQKFIQPEKKYIIEAGRKRQSQQERQGDPEAPAGERPRGETDPSNQKG